MLPSPLMQRNKGQRTSAVAVEPDDDDVVGWRRWRSAEAPQKRTCCCASTSGRSSTSTSAVGGAPTLASAPASSRQGCLTSGPGLPASTAPPFLPPPSVCRPRSPLLHPACIVLLSIHTPIHPPTHPSSQPAHPSIHPVWRSVCVFEASSRIVAFIYLSMCSCMYESHAFLHSCRAFNMGS